MFTLKQALLLAVVGTAYAAPLAHRHRGDYDGPMVGRLPGTQSFDNDGDDQTVTIVTYGGPSQTSSGETTVTIQPYAGGQQQGGSDDSESQSTTQGTPSTSDSGSASSESGYMGIVNTYRKKGGLPELKQDSKLEANALKTARDGNGQMKHELNPGTMGQVLAPGNANNFESVYVGGWLCEMPSLPGLNGACGTMKAGWDHSNGETGHAKILTSTSYSKIGCALAGGIWACDVA